MMPFWPDFETLTDTQLIMEEQNIPVIRQFWPKRIINEAYILHNCIECFNSHVIFYTIVLSVWLSYVVFMLSYIIYILFCHLQYAVVYSMLLFGLLTAKL